MTVYSFYCAKSYSNFNVLIAPFKYSERSAVSFEVRI